MRMKIMESLNNILYYHKHQFIPVDRTLELYFTGCSIKCKNCQNYFLQERNKENTRILTVEELISELKDYPFITKQVHILGGEPLEQDLVILSNLLKELRKMKFHDIILFTGYNLSLQDIKEKMFLFQYCDYVKIGNYDESQLNTEKELIPNGPDFQKKKKNQTFIKINTSENGD